MPRESDTRTTGVVCAEGPELDEAVAAARTALGREGLPDPSPLELRDTVWLARRLCQQWPVAIAEAAAIIARRRAPPLPSPYSRR